MTKLNKYGMEVNAHGLELSEIERLYQDTHDGRPLPQGTADQYSLRDIYERAKVEISEALNNNYIGDMYIDKMKEYAQQREFRDEVQALGELPSLPSSWRDDPGQLGSIEARADEYNFIVGMLKNEQMPRDEQSLEADESVATYELEYEAEDYAPEAGD
ncbi:MAG: hypothetical protein AAF449_00985 [Myxococcota bacterium]